MTATWLLSLCDAIETTAGKENSAKIHRPSSESEPLEVSPSHSEQMFSSHEVSQVRHPLSG